MDYKKNKSKIWNRFLVQILTVMMVFSMMPSQTFAYYAATDETGTVAEEQAAPAGDQTDNKDQGGADAQAGSQDDKEDPDTPAVQPDVPDNNTDSGVPAADQKQGDVDQQKDNADDTKPAASDAKKGTDGAPAVENGTKAPEAPAEDKADGAKDEGEKPTISPAEMAEKLYGDGGDPDEKAKTFTVELTCDSPTAKAGETVEYNVNVNMWPAATYPYDGQNQKVMFEKWENITITLKLPKNVKVTGNPPANVESITPISEEDNTYKVVLKSNYRDAHNSNTVNFDVSATIQGNGTLPDGLVLGKKDTDDQAYVTVYSEWNVRINEDGTTQKYDKTVKAYADPITLTTPDKWTVVKSVAGDKAYTIDKDNGTVTVHYIVEYGLSINGVLVDDQNPGVYTNFGRVPFAKDKGVQLKDIPALKLPSGDPLDHLSLTVTPVGTGYVYSDGRPAGSQPIQVRDDQYLDLPYAVLGEERAQDKNISPDAPFYSKYKVDVTYDYSNFMVWFYNYRGQKDSDSKNDAWIAYRLLGHENDADPITVHDDAEQKIPAYIPPGKIIIEKYIVEYNTVKENLYKAEKGFVKGPARYEVYDDKGNAATLYYLDGDEYRTISGNTVTIDPSKDKSPINGNDGTIEFYVVGGKDYTVKEVGMPAYTEIDKTSSIEQTKEVEEDEEETYKFKNKELLGAISIHKQDDTEKPVKGAVFGLYTEPNVNSPAKDAAGQNITVTTDDAGNAVFERLTPGNYYVYEISVSSDYIKDNIFHPITVKANETATLSEPIINEKNYKNINLIKRYSTVDNPTEFDKNVTADYNAFHNAFVLQVSKNNGQTWDPVEGGGVYSIGPDGIAHNIRVKQYDDAGHKLMYRFKETIPEGYYDEQGHDRTLYPTATSYSITPAAGDAEIIMNNQKDGFIELTKKKVSVNESTGIYNKIVNGSGKTFKLYRTAGNSSVAEFVKEGTTGTDGTLKFTGLVGSNGSGGVYTYYVVEQDTEAGYHWITNCDITISGESGTTPALRIGSFTSADDGALRATTYNVEQKIVIGIVKRDKLSDTILPGATFKINNGTEEIVSSDTAVMIPIELGQKYTITEESVPAGYYKDASKEEIDTRNWKVTRTEQGSYVVLDENNEKVTIPKIFTFKDTPYQKLYITKSVKKIDQTETTTLTGISFKVYIKNADGTFSAYKKDGKDLVIPADGTTKVSLPDSDDNGNKIQYYLHEEYNAEKKDDIVYPDNNPEFYEDVKHATYDGMFLFGPYTLDKPTGENGDTEIEVPIVNISNKADLIVHKRVWDDEDKEVSPPPAGFSMNVYTVDDNGNLSSKPVASKTTGSGGDPADQASFTLPVYDENGTKIKYVVKEIYSKNQEKLYYTDNFTASECRTNPIQLDLRKTGTNASDAGYVDNHQYLAVEVVKKYYDAREFALTGLKYELEGATIALYRHNDDDTYTFVASAVTDADGKVSFSPLTYSKKGYVAIEVSVPDLPEYKHMMPADGTNYLGTIQDTLTDEQVRTLSKAILQRDPKDRIYKGEIDNMLPWTQIHITKWNEDETIKKDGANFTLYKQVLPEGTTGGKLTFDANDKDTTIVGEYTSGTWIQNDKAVEGEFQTDVLEYAKNIVYWLVETKAPSGYKIRPEERIILFPAEGTTYENDSFNHQSTLVHPGLIVNQINRFDVHNDPLQGPPGTENWAYIKFTKWMQDKDKAGKTPLERGDFKLMPNATFELYAVNPTDHNNKVLLLDTITTGDENSVTAGSKTTGYGVSRSMDAWAIFDQLEDMFPDTWDQIITYKSTDDKDVNYPYQVDEQGKPIVVDGKRVRIPGTFVLNAVLIEKSTSSKYAVDLHDHNMQITFIPSDLELGNEKYSVPDLEEYDAPLCDENDDIRDSYTINDPHSMAIVDYLSTKNSVVLRHFGYDPEQSQIGYNKVHDELEALHDRYPSLFTSQSVTFRMEKKTSQDRWTAWDPVNNTAGNATFDTDGNGVHFDKLTPGEYRVIMTRPAKDNKVDPPVEYENFYPDPTDTSEDLTFHFTVVSSDKTQVFTTYSPARPKVTIKKTKRNGDTINGEATFTLTGTGGYSQTAKTSTTDGTAVFTNLPADATFVLKETNPPTGYTNEYFKLLFAKKYQKYKDLVDENVGYKLSYQTTTRDGQMVIKHDIDYKAEFSLEAPNIETVNLELFKKDSKDNTDLKDAKFKVYFYAFDKLEDQFEMPAFDPETWKDLTKQQLLTSDNEGKYLAKNISPGVYYVVEQEAPKHYERDTTPQAIVMTGGLDITPRGNPGYVYKIHTDITKPGELTFTDKPLVKIKVDKTVNFGSVPAEDYSFSFELKSEDTPAVIKTATGTAKDGVIDPDSKTFAEFEDIKQGKRYYLKENSEENYQLLDVYVGNDKVEVITEGKYQGYYPIDVPEGMGIKDFVSVRVANTFMKARVTLFKYDGMTANRVPLPGASFVVLDANKEPVNKAEVNDNGDGTYTAIIPLSSSTGTNFYIRETKAPEIEGKKYVIDEGNKDILIEGLKPGENRPYTFNKNYQIPNYQGINLKLKKYGGLPEGDNKPLNDISFQLYFSSDGERSWTTWGADKSTEGDGEANFLILKGSDPQDQTKNYSYAVAEISGAPGYDGLYGIYDRGGNPLTKKAQSTDGRELTVLGDSFNYGQEDDYYTFKAYNIPFLELVVEKQDISGQVKKPETEFCVYEVPDGTSETLTDSQVKALVDAAEADETVRKLPGKTDGGTYTNNRYIRPGKTYLAVEKHAIDSDSPSDDYSIIKDDPRVVWYKVFNVPEENYASEYKVTFKNNKRSASVGLGKGVLEEKDVVVEKNDQGEDEYRIPSLIKDSADVVYTISPTATNSYPLNSYVVNDTGLSVLALDGATKADEWYNFTGVTVGKARMDKDLDGKAYDIFAKVTFKDFSDNEVYTQTVNVTNAEQTVTPAAGGKNIKSFRIEYDSPDLRSKTGYALGQNFEVDSIKANATIFKQPKPDQGYITAIKKIRNDADVLALYSPWSSTGEKQQPPTPLTAQAHADIVVKDAKAPKVDFQKIRVSQDGKPLPHEEDQFVELNSKVFYRLTLNNVTGEDIDFTDPIIVDLLPQGVVVDPQTDYIKIQHKPGTITGDPTVTIGSAGDSQYVNIAFTGTVPNGESIVVDLTANVTEAVTNYGTRVLNCAFTTSKEVGVATSENQTGATIRDEGGMWAIELVDLAKNLGCSEERAKALKDALNALGDNQGDYGYLGDNHEATYETENQLVCVKAEYGPRDGGVYRTDRVSVIANDDKNVDQRTMHYQLTINNLTSNMRTNLAVMDIMPVVDDKRINNTDRGSHWPLFFDKITSVKVNGNGCKEGTDYTVYYYTGDAYNFTAGDIADIVNESKARCPAGWTDSRPSTGKITAIIVAFAYDPADTNKTVKLEGQKNLQIEYTANIDYYEDQEELAKIVFTNAANDFNFGYSTVTARGSIAPEDLRPGDPLGSNVVEVTIAPPFVKVGGDVWIDADDDGFQNDGDNQTWYLKFAVVRQLLKDLGVSLNISDLKSCKATDHKGGTIEETGDKPNYGIAHFEFDELTSAKLRNGSTDYKNWYDPTLAEPASKLIGQNPYTYNMSLSYRGKTFRKTVNKVDPRGSYVPGNIPTEDMTDDNFEKLEQEESRYQTEQFFLHQTSDIFDMTKDVGFNLSRNLVLEKYSRATKQPVEGVEFTIYGPYEHDTTDADTELKEKDVVARLTTDDKGKIEKEGLLFFKEYVIVESKPATGFGIEGAHAEGNIKKLDEGKWLLQVPDFDYMPAEGEEDKVLTEQVAIEDPENIDVAVEKIWEDEADAYGSRPKAINVMLYTDEDCKTEAKYADGSTVESKTLNAGNGWKATWTDLPQVKVEKGTDNSETETTITYYVKETDSSGSELKGYNAKIVSTTEATTGNQILTITNTLKSTGLKVNKKWEDTAEIAALVTSVTFRAEQSTDGKTWTPVKNNGNMVYMTIERKPGETMGTAEISGLPVYDADNNQLKYRAVEVSYTTRQGKTIKVVYDSDDLTSGTAGAYTFTSKTSGNAENGFTTDIENKLVKGGLQVTKEWKNSDKAKKPGSLTIELKAYANGKEIELSGVKKSIKLSKSNHWTDYTTWAQLPVYDADGSKITYELKESGKGKFKAEYEVYYNGSVIKDGDGQKLKVTIYPKETVEVTFINTLNPPKTGDEMPLAPYMALGLASLTGLLYLFYRRRRTS